MAKSNRKKRTASKEEITTYKPSEENHNQLIQQLEVYNKFKLSPRHQVFVDGALAPEVNMLWVDGPAGAGKTFLSIYAALKLLKEGKISKIIYVRTLVESASHKMGYLPGDSNEKIKPWAIPLMEKCDELIKKSMTDKLIKEEIIQCVPVNHLRGSTFMNCAVLVDESQNFSDHELTTVLTRFGKNCKMFILGDSLQNDINNSGFKKYLKGFDNEELKENGIFAFQFTEDDIVRSKLLKLIVKTIKNIHEFEPKK